jgi:hypothetical protein
MTSSVSKAAATKLTRNENMNVLYTQSRAPADTGAKVPPLRLIAAAAMQLLQLIERW